MIISRMRLTIVVVLLFGSAWPCQARAYTKSLQDEFEWVIEEHCAKHQEEIRADYQKNYDDLQQYTTSLFGWAMAFVGALATIFGAVLPLLYQWRNSRSIAKAEKLSSKIAIELQMLNEEKLAFKADLYLSVARSAFETYRMTGAVNSIRNAFVQADKCLSLNSEKPDPGGVYSCLGFLNSVHMLLSGPKRAADKNAIRARMKGFEWSVTETRINELVDMLDETEVVKNAVKGFYRPIVTTYS